jgi:D-3-phosphoglycerate dehydrogenase / 2-oxoglutarate reductase
VEYLGDIAEADGRTLGLSVLKGLLAPVCSEPVTFVNAPLIADERGLNLREVSDPTPRTTSPCSGSPDQP